MQAETQTLLTQLVTLAGLIGGTIEYAEIVKRRAQLRLQVAERKWFEEDGLRGLVRVFAQSEAPVKPRRWRHFAVDRRRRRLPNR